MSLQWCIAKKTMDELHCWCHSVARTYTAVGHFASSRKHLPVFQLVVLICHQINDLTDRVLPVGVLSRSTSHHGVSPFASFPAYKHQNSPFRILWNIRSLIFAISFSISPDSQTCGSIVWNLAKTNLQTMKAEEGYELVMHELKNKGVCIMHEWLFCIN